MLLVTEYFAPHPGGTAVYYYELVRRMADVRWTVVARQHPEARAFDRRQPFRIIRTPFPPLPKVRMAVEWLAHLLVSLWLTVREGVDVLHAGQLFPVGLAVYVVHRLTGVPYVAYVHGEELTTLGRKRLAGWAIRTVLARAEAVFVNSRFTGRQVRRFGVPHTRIRLVRPGVDLGRFQPADGAGLRAQHGVRDGAVLLTVGRLIPRKGQDTVIRLLRDLLQHGPVAYWIAGEGTEEERRRLRGIARDEGVEAHVRFLGVVPDAELPLLYSACDVFVMLNRTTPEGDVEGFGMVFLEAGACGRPVVGGASGGAVEAVWHGVTGYLVPEGDREAAVHALRTLLLDPQLRARMGEAGRRFAWVHSWERSAEKVRAMCMQLCSWRQARRTGRERVAEWWP
ncbi:MAG: glycosyltransferase family 4 protein [bacterium]